MKSYLIELVAKYGPFLTAGSIGAIIRRIKNKMTLKQFIGQVLVSAFFAWCIGIPLQYWLKLPNEVIYSIVGIVGIFADILYSEIEGILKNIQEWVKLYIETRFKKKTN